MNSTEIQLTNVNKEFKLPLMPSKHFREYLIRFHKMNFRRLLALKNVNLKVMKGEFLSVIGNNGSGKSTLLKVIAGIYSPTSGKVITKSKISSFLELGVGFNGELTAVENIKLYGAIMGLTKKETLMRMDAIFDYSELEEFKYSQLRTFSNGMHVRLAFAVAIQNNAPVFLVDEVLAVGDASFREKCYKTFDDFKKQGKTIVFVSHDMNSIIRFSDRIICFESGYIVDDGGLPVIDRYLQTTLNKKNTNR